MSIRFFFSYVNSYPFNNNNNNNNNQFIKNFQKHFVHKLKAFFKRNVFSCFLFMFGQAVKSDNSEMHPRSKVNSHMSASI